MKMKKTTGIGSFALDAKCKAYQLAWLCRSWKAAKLEAFVPFIDGDAVRQLHSWLAARSVAERRAYVAGIDRELGELDGAAVERVALLFVNGFPRLIVFDRPLGAATLKRPGRLNRAASL